MEQGAKGNFRINFNTNKEPGDNQPVLERGIISTPDAPDEVFECKLWSYTDKAGRVFYAGPSAPVRRDASGLDRAEALTLAEVHAVDVAEAERRSETAGAIDLAPHRIMLFRNSFKLAKTDQRYADLSDAEKAVNDKRPELYGFWNPGPDRSGSARPQLRVSVWQQEGRYGPFLAGNTQEAREARATEPQEPAEPVERTSARNAKGRRTAEDRSGR